ncbi:uncharacterized protein LOC113779049 [Coffea eugenioides]|uniref:DUF7880 domain-containing protein n=1 Tax=Coffea arabica TaxID=13443 RepID=A0A6P6TPK6_COFAR|nr:uncharacterized protein LOC113703016 [Coffea arabica]XP_027180267.1 uncharacterized protein LOC113779049 [Coffea eugenioides]
MAILNTNADVSMGRLSSLISPAILTLNQRKKHTSEVGCALFMQERRQSRRGLVSAALALLNCLSLPKDAMGGGIFDKYLKRKKLDPLESYVPAVILTELQIKDLGKSLDFDQPRFDDCRILLRSGPAASLRINIRAVAQYATDDGDNKSAFDNVDECLRALEELDSLLLHASRNDPGASIQSMKGKIDTAVDALDSLLKTVPSDVLEKGKAIADAYRDSEDDAAAEALDPELKQLESIL